MVKIYRYLQRNGCNASLQINIKNIEGNRRNVLSIINFIVMLLFF